MKTSALIVAAGRGTRAGGEIPKQYQPLLGRAVLSWTIERFVRHPAIDKIIVVLHPEDGHLFNEHCSEWANDVIQVAGGATRDASVRAGLNRVSGERVLIHDGARPLVPDHVIDGVLRALNTAPGAAPALPVSDALWRGDLGRVQGPQSREGLYRAQTPQGFETKSILAAHASVTAPAADDVEVALAAGLAVEITDGSEDNIKLTYPGDFARAERLIKESTMDVRTGNGFDVHKFTDGTAVILCGVEIPHTHALLGHSDADVGMHAVTDAIYGALGMGDIGQHFPPSDPQWKGAASDIFLKHAADLAREHGFTLTHADCTLICEQPKIGPHTGTMKQEMARIMGITPDRVSIKATTSETLGFTGRKEGIAAIATATLVKA
ncbi:MAG: bifunctional 2-C-methyl-D-erythritol 4-phosphate cytidylyltransferase/2-C-methyl-D-erythritol 2,4-cyclodiphosphate synthase [Pseudomonadota bacterium]|nr:bifunctional 2-C-methyl-D-erythritol 4-phosphate cytidylyltransferase/2-C-methyl-D-erythritol 2,4-cyclodiphosphate synthase [Pseudomonadota bacterium]MEC8796305.1 bifunctional 2-C-methyl-D-erythritol 4-phosphate cytidylyltransferase/2-C-methyl-D-erythritol 2,4-cyclodiphosphate synthase [Pseudomonadota bacterium]